MVAIVKNVFFVLLMLANFLSFATYSLQAPILPREAQNVHATATQIGIIFGIYEVANLIACPLVGNYVGRIGAKKLFNIGTLALGFSTIAFGFINLFTSTTFFVAVACGLRMFEATGAAIVDVGIYSIVGDIFPENLETRIGLMEGVYGVALSLGPYMGTTFYEIGGFRLPFIVTGILVLVTGFLIQVIMPKSPRSDKSSDLEEKDDTSLLTYIRNPVIVLNFLVVIFGAIQFSGVQSFLERHLSQFELSPTGVGQIFLLYAGINAASTPIFAYICGKLRIPEVIPFAGAIIYVVAYVFLGPAPFTSFVPSLNLVVLGACLQSLANASTFISGFVLALKEAKRITPHRAESATTGAISSLYISTISIGCLIGPIIGGILNDAFGMRYMTMGLLAVAVCQMLLIPVLIRFKAVTVVGYSKLGLATVFEIDESQYDEESYAKKKLSFSISEPMLRRISVDSMK